MTTHRPGAVSDARLDPGHGVEDTGRIIVVEASGIGERHGSRGPRDEACPEAFLEQLDLPAQKCRRDAEILRRTGETAAFNDAAEGAHDGKLVHLGKKSAPTRSSWDAYPVH